MYCNFVIFGTGRKQEQVEISRLQTLSISIFMKKPVVKTMAVAYGLMLAQQFSGINAMIFYGVTILESTGVGMESLIELSIFGVVQVVACVAATLLIDKVTLLDYCDINSVSQISRFIIYLSRRLTLRLRNVRS